MFTGIIETTTNVTAKKSQGSSLRLTFAKPSGWDIAHGQSIAHDGVCLTVASQTKDSYTTELMAETLAKTSFGVKVPARVNLERALSAAKSFDGHIVQGHVDAVAKLSKIEHHEQDVKYWFSYPDSFAGYIVAKGSITVDGISLTVVDDQPGCFSVALIEYTRAHTTIADKHIGDPVNIEFDVIGKYVAKQLALRS